MEKPLIISVLLIFLFHNTLSEMTREKRENLMLKVAKKIDILNYNIYSPLKPLNNFYERGETFSYDPNKIKEIIKENGFPESFNFIDEYNPTVNVKDQQGCGCCWAFAASTALAYRYKKQGIDVDLSPQSLLSCYVKDCDDGGYLLDSQFYLVKGGATTETCIPFSSGDGSTIEECPTKCKENEEFKKYYAKNSYATTFEYDTDKYYDVVTLIMDQLVNFGPVASGISCYSDLQELIEKDQCKDVIYKYDGVSYYLGGHAVAIVGYGYSNSKYYWIIQNSWGKNFCDNGFAKIEFAEIGIENVAFSEPYIEDENNLSTGKDISTKMTIQGDCKLKYTTESNNYEDSFEINFKHTDIDYSNYYYQCSKDPTNKGNSGLCSFEFKSFIENEKGYYQYKNYSALKNDKNTFSFDFSSLNNKRFYYYGADYIDNYYLANKEFYVSEEGSGMILYYESLTYDSNLVSKIYPNKNTNTALSNCKLVEIEGYYYLIYCKISKNDLNIIQVDNNLPIAYDILCGNKEETTVVVRKLDKAKYPVYRVKKFVLPYEEELSYENELLIIADIEGSISGIKSNNVTNSFAILLEAYFDDYNEPSSLDMICYIPNPTKLQKDFEISCQLPYDLEGYSYKKVYITQYYSPIDMNTPFELIINKKIRGTKYRDHVFTYNTNSKFIKTSLLLFLYLLFLL